MKIALVHDYLKEYGGAERVVEQLHQIFPDAPLYTAYYNPKMLGKDADRFKGWNIKVSWMQKIPGIGRLLSPLKFLSPMAFESFDLSKYEVVISSSAAYFAKGVITGQNSVHIAYIHTPPRSLYGYTNGYWYKKNIATKVFGEILNHFMRLYDFELSQRADVLIANSENIKQRIAKFYRRDAQVVYPPIDLSEYKELNKESGDYFLSLARLDPEKNIDLVIKTFNHNGLPLKIVGTGREEKKLKKLAQKNIQFLGKVSDKERVLLLANAKALICAASHEDFGITSIESQASGTPVIALEEGGFKETIIDGKTGIFFNELTIESLQKAIEKFLEQKFKIEDLQKNVQKYSNENFKKQILALIKETKPQPSKNS
jgi:glycosyltransferase involved in cell wall biosynthesis